MSLLVIDSDSSSEHTEHESIQSGITTLDPPDPPPDPEKKLLNISFSGGGFKGAAFLGCVKALYEHNMMKNVSSVAGTSAGAITATFLACKADYQYMKTCMLGTLKHFEKYRITWYNLLKNAKNFTEEFGIHRTDELRAYFIECINNATNTDNDLTFIELYHLTGIKLIITAACLDNQTPFYFSYETTRDTPISEALTISVNIPLVFTSKKFENKTLVDGCIVENLPMQCWPEYELENTLAFLVKSKNEVYEMSEPDPIDNVYEYLQKLMSSMKKEKDTWYYEKFKDTITIIMAGNISAYKKFPSKDDIHTVVHSAYFQTIKSLQTRGFLETSEVPQGGFISSFIVADMDSEEEEDDHIFVAYQVLSVTTLLLMLLILLHFFKKL